jgi:hypothetical protein
MNGSTGFKGAFALIVLGAFSCLLVTSCTEFRSEKQQAGAKAPLISTYASLNENIFAPKCTSCHSGPTSPHSIDLSSYNSILNSPVFPPLIIPGDPEGSSLYQSCMSGKMPKNSPALPEGHMKAIYDWIKSGAREHDEGALPPVQPGVGSAGTASPHEPCDPSRVGNEPGFIQCADAISI